VLPLDDGNIATLSCGICDIPSELCVRPHANLEERFTSHKQSWYWTVLGTGPPVRTASSRSGPVLDSGTGRPVLSRELPVRTGSSAGDTPAEF
jgi:hypothetical protein